MFYHGQGRPTSITNLLQKNLPQQSGVSSIKASEGFTLVEILVAMVLIAIGFLGMLSMQSFSLQQTSDTFFSNKANYLIRDLTDRMRLNPTQVPAYAFNTQTQTIVAQDCTANTCSPAQIAQHDIAEWAAAVGQLPNGRGLITSNNNIVDILISWEEKDSRLASTLSSAALCGAQDVDDTSLRRCISLRVHI